MATTPPVTLSSRLDAATHGEPVVQALRDLARVATDQHQQLATLAQTLTTLPRALSIQQIRQALQVSGGTPLNITELIPSSGTGGSGVSIQVGTHANRGVVDTSTLAVGDLYLETDRVAVYEWTATGWLFIGNFYSPMDVTLSPNTKPADLGAADVGFWIWSTDFARGYKWTGAAWAEDNHNDSRYQIGMFAVAPDQNGWTICDGSTISRSTTTGGVTNYTTPDLITANRFLRAANAAGGTGGAATHTHAVDPPSTASSGPTPNVTSAPSATETVDNDLIGSTVAVGSATHTHDLGAHTHTTDIASFTSGSASSLPPYYDCLPYIRI